jgi:hypothetical protein
MIDDRHFPFDMHNIFPKLLTQPSAISPFSWQPIHNTTSNQPNQPLDIDCQQILLVNEAHHQFNQCPTIITLAIGHPRWLMKHFFSLVNPIIDHQPLLGWRGKWWHGKAHICWHEMTHHNELWTWIMWHDTWMLTWHDTWMMTWNETSSPCLLHRPSTVSLRWLEHHTKLVNSWTSSHLGIKNFSCWIKKHLQVSQCPTFIPSTVNNLC